MALEGHAVGGAQRCGHHSELREISGAGRETGKHRKYIKAVLGSGHLAFEGGACKNISVPPPPLVNKADSFSSRKAAHDIKIVAHAHGIKIVAHAHVIKIMAHTHGIKIVAHAHGIKLIEHVFVLALHNFCLRKSSQLPPPRVKSPPLPPPPLSSMNFFSCFRMLQDFCFLNYSQPLPRESNGSP